MSIPLFSIVLFFAPVTICAASLLRSNSTRGRGAMDYAKVANTKCMDGSPAGYFYRLSPAVSHDWVIMLQGGGICVDKDECTDRAEDVLGSSDDWKDTRNPSGLLSVHRNRNPSFYNANHVYLPYCTGDAWSGQKKKSVFGKKKKGYFFQGHTNFGKIIKHIHDNMANGQSKLKRVLLTGHSVGGLGALINCDYLQTHLETLRDQSNDKVDATLDVRCVPQDGWLWPTTVGVDKWDENSYWERKWYKKLPTRWDVDQKNQSDQNQQREMPHHIASHYWEKIGTRFEPFKPVACGSSAWCGNAHYIYRTINRPVFIVQDQFDWVLIRDYLGLGKHLKEDGANKFIKYVGEVMYSSIVDSVDRRNEDGRKDRYLITSCWSHGKNGYQDMPVNSDEFWTKLVGRWFNDDLDQSTGPCSNADGLPCDSRCGGVPAVQCDNLSHPKTLCCDKSYTESDLAECDDWKNGAR